MSSGCWAELTTGQPRCVYSVVDLLGEIVISLAIAFTSQSPTSTLLSPPSPAPSSVSFNSSFYTRNHFILFQSLYLSFTFFSALPHTQGLVRTG